MQKTTYATLIQLSAGVGGLLSIFIPFPFSIVAPLVMWIAGGKNEFNDWHGREAVRFQLMMWLYTIIFAVIFAVIAFKFLSVTDAQSAVLLLMTSIPLVIVILAYTAFVLVMPFVAAYKASKGEYYVYPYTFSPRRNQKRKAAGP